MKPDELFSTRQAAEYLGVSIATLKRHLYETEWLEPFTRNGKNLVFVRSQLDELREKIEASETKPGSAKIKLPDDIIEALGTEPDKDLATRAGVSSRTIFRRRHERGIPAYSRS